LGAINATVSAPALARSGRITSIRVVFTFCFIGFMKVLLNPNFVESEEILSSMATVYSS